VDTWRFISYRTLGGFENMALDEALFRMTHNRGKRPTLRLFGWECPTLTIGHFQDPKREVNREFCESHGISVVRRPTGGKAVYHSTDLTYSISACQGPPFSADILTTYEVISKCLVRGLEKVGIKAGVVEEGRRNLRAGVQGGSCFATPFRNELLVRGAKICGSAQLRSHGRFLQHGSILMDFDPVITARITVGPGGDMVQWVRLLSESVTSVNREVPMALDAEALAPFICEGFEEALGIRLESDEPTPREEAEKNRLLNEKYRNPRWNDEGRL